MIQRDTPHTTRREREDVQEYSSVILALPAVNMKKRIIKNKKNRKRERGTKSHEETEDVVESQNEKKIGEKIEEAAIESKEEKDEEECSEHWTCDFAQQLIEGNEGRIPPQDQQIAMIPNPLFKELLQL